MHRTPSACVLLLSKFAVDAWTLSANKDLMFNCAATGMHLQVQDDVQMQLGVREVLSERQKLGVLGNQQRLGQHSEGDKQHQVRLCVCVS